MPQPIHEQIAANKRLSVVYSIMTIVLLTLLGGAIVGAYEIKYWWMGAAGAFLAGTIAAIVGWTKGQDIVLKFSNARTATKKELAVLNNVTEEMALAAGIPVPDVYLIDDPTPNAFATGKDPENGIVCVTTGLMEQLDRDELQGVIAHEIGHIRNNDIKLLTVLALVLGLIPLLVHFFLRSLWYGGGSRRRDSSGGGQAQMIMLVVAIALAILAPIFAKLLELAVSRQREYMADASAAQFTRNPHGLASALRKISKPQTKLESNPSMRHMYIVNPLRPFQKKNSLWSTHPPIDERIRRLEGTSGMSAKRLMAEGDFSDMPDIPDQRNEPPVQS
jgi:heat shock protein HtpX